MAVDVEDLWLQALDAQNEDDRDEMCRLTDDIIAADPEHAEAYYYLGIAYLNQGDSTKAVQFLREGAKLGLKSDQE